MSASHVDSAVALADILYYNVRQSRGGLDLHALTFANKLSVLLTRAGRTRDAARVHAEVLRDLDEHRGARVEAGEKERLRGAADLHLEGLRRCGWAARPEGKRMASAFYERLGKRYGALTVPSVDKWGAVDAKKDREVTYSGPTAWSLVVEKETVKRDLIIPAKERWGWHTKGPVVTMEEVTAV